MKETGATSSYLPARCSSRLSGGLSTTTGTAGCPCSLPRLRRRSWRPVTHCGVYAAWWSGCVVAPIVVSIRRRPEVVNAALADRPPHAVSVYTGDVRGGSGRGDRPRDRER